jgi:RimJ/RimL family protein N-acetyltransferase
MTLVLETERMTLRWFEESDAAFILALLNDPAWLANIGERNVRSLEDARRWIADRLIPTYRSTRHGSWAMIRQKDGVLLGMCGLLQRDFLPELDVGYALSSQFRGQGYAREATRACLDYARTSLGKRRVLAIVAPGNLPSLRLLRAVGMIEEPRAHVSRDLGDAAIYRWP